MAESNELIAELISAVEAEHAAWRNLHGAREFVGMRTDILPALMLTHIKARERTAKALAAVKAGA